MPRNEEGEFELILGNKQLLTVFFIVVVLLGIFATMGYIVGRSAAPTAAATAKSDSASSVPPLVVDPMKPAPAGAQTDGGSPAPADLAPGQVSVGTHAPAPAPAETKPQPEPKPAAPPAAEKKETKPPVKADANAPIFVEPSVGQVYIQVAAVAKADADVIIGMLRKRSYPAVIAAGPAEREKLHRVLVGPYKDAAEISKVRADLVTLGFTTAFVKKY